MKLVEKPLTTLLAEFRSSAATPGGGSAAALAGALGASLFTMVANLPKPRAATESELQKLDDARAHSAALAKQLEALVDRDSEAYDLVISAYRMPKQTDDEKAVRSTRIQEALTVAIEAPLEVMRACAAAIALGPVLAAYGNANASSDVKVGLELMRAGLRGARLNVEINLGSVKDPDYVARVKGEMDRLSESGAAAAPNASA
jgi:formiminotetrahydrofolate cyclodeaminase